MKDKICRIAIVITGLAFLLTWYFDPTYSADFRTNALCKSIVFHLLGSVIFSVLLVYFGYKVFHRPSRSAWLLVTLPCLAVVVNNLPIIALLTGEATVTRPALAPLFLLDCLLIGAFEEIAFRGTLFLAVLKRHRASTKQIFLTVALSSAVFGLSHLANLLEGAGIGATLLQVGYSFLIGGMCSIVLLKTGNLLICILLHTIFDVGGGFISVLGTGNQWNAPTVWITVILALAVSAWMINTLLRVAPRETDRFYQSVQKQNETAN